MIELEQAIEIFEKHGIKAVKNSNGMLIISHYVQPKGTTFKELGINEDELIQYVEECQAVFDTRNSSLTTFPLVTCRELRLDKDTKIAELPNLKSVGTFLANEYLKKAPRLKTIGTASLENSNIRSLPKLREAGILTVQSSKLEELESLEKVIKLCIVDSPISNLKSLEYAQDIFICSTDIENKNPILSLPSLTEVQNIFVANSNLKSLPKLKIAKKVALYNCEIKSFKAEKDTEIEIKNHISDDELNEKFDTFTDWYNSELLDKSINLIGNAVGTM